MRAVRGLKREKTYLMNTLVRSMMMYGVEIWGCGAIERLEKVHARYCKYVLGVAKNTPEYIWRAELGERGLKAVVRERFCRYIKDVMDMEEDRWPRVCLREECRGIMNKNQQRGENV